MIPLFLWILLALEPADVEAPVPPEARAAVLGSALLQAAVDPLRPIDEVLRQAASSEGERGLRLRALVFADLHLRGLKRHCLAGRGRVAAAPRAEAAWLPAAAFTDDEHRRTRALVPALRADLDRLWRRHARTYHDEIRALKRGCPVLPARLRSLRVELHEALDRPGSMVPELRAELHRLLDDYAEAMDIESAFPRLQYAVNGLSYRLGLQGLQDPRAVPALRAFVDRYARFVDDPADRTRLQDQALEVSHADAGLALWLIAFAFRNYPHIYDVYLLDPVRAAQLEILFLRLKVLRQRILDDEEKMLLHYPAATYRSGDRRSSPYHFWSGGYVAHQLWSRGHRPVLAALAGGAAQGVYEVTAALRQASTQRQVGTSFGARVRYFVDRSATFEDAAGGMLGAFAAIDMARRQLAQRVDDLYPVLRREAWRGLEHVRALRPLYDGASRPAPVPDAGAAR